MFLWSSTTVLLLWLISNILQNESFSKKHYKLIEILKPFNFDCLNEKKTFKQT